MNWEYTETGSRLLVCGCAETVEDDTSMNLQKFKGAVCYGPVEITESQSGAHAHFKLDAQIFIFKAPTLLNVSNRRLLNVCKTAQFFLLPV